ncbi:MAG: acetyl-CoA carboxylase carboxyl transferase subunit alpha [Epsilonproteobacteria bacterium]|nr:MAG: acetyl-CoA carboxylase carboxyl transferase subunit alpha [Campylobacterota bacterium]RLA67938.1 MAG: acetyl-CoA carboxylase carboxyl transferase subunit alpha [Campylobacterota bacterium]
MSIFTLNFEKPVKVLEDQIEELKLASCGKGIDVSSEIKALERKTSQLIKEIYSKLTPWEQVQLSRHPNRPHTKDYVSRIFDDFYELHGDRKFADDPAVIAGFGKLDGQRVAVVGIEKGRKTKEKLHHNFGMPRPEGYRKALRIMKMASRFSVPIITFIDTPGAYPGIGAEERGQASAIAENIEEMFDLDVPVVSIVIGEGGSGGALGLAIADKLLMLEYSIYSVISPESCASILWADSKMAETAANSLQLGALKAMELKVADEIIGEPSGGAHRDPDEITARVKKALYESINKLKNKSPDELKSSRYNKYRSLGKESLI